MPDSIEDRLAALATRLDEEAPPLDTDEILGRSEPVKLRHRRAPFAIGAGMLAAAAAVTAFLVIAGDNRPQHVDTADTPGTTVTTAPLPADDVLPWQPEYADKVRLLVFDNNDMALVDYSGKEYGRARLGSWYTNDPDNGVDLTDSDGSVKPVAAVALDDPVDGCHNVHGAGGVRVAACGGLGDDRPSEIRLIGPTGEERTLSGPVSALVGHWRFGLPSPDGRWVLAEWSAECEVPEAYFIEVSTGARTEIPPGQVSRAIGWAPDGRAIVGFGTDGGCGEKGPQEGTYLLNPDTGQQGKIHSFFAGALIVNTHPEPWNRLNRLERLMSRARAEMGNHGCCGEPNRGGTTSVDGIELEGHQIEVYSVPLENAAEYEQAGMRGLPFTCGRAVYWLSEFDRSSSDRGLLERAADLLVPHLYCARQPSS